MTLESLMQTIEINDIASSIIEGRQYNGLILFVKMKI